jgi:hypothetical protein
MEGGLCYFHANPDKAAELGRSGDRRRKHVYQQVTETLPLPESAATNWGIAPSRWGDPLDVLLGDCRGTCSYWRSAASDSERASTICEWVAGTSRADEIP